MADLLGKIEIFVFNDGKCPMTASDSLSDFQIQNVLSSLIVKVNQTMTPRDVRPSEKIKQQLYNALLQIFGGDDGFPIIAGLAWCINRVNLKMSEDKRKEKLLTLREPEIRIVN